MIQLLILRGSESGRALSEATGIYTTWWQGHTHEPREGVPILNWGVQGSALTRFQEKYPWVRALPMVNGNRVLNKLSALRRVESAGVPIPETRDFILGFEGWLYKPNHSIGGNGIYRLDPEEQNTDWTHGYAQKEIVNRRYEVRVSAFNWMPPDQWGYWKKVYTGENANQLTWNHEQGGTFITVNRALQYPLYQRLSQYAQRALNALGLQFGAIDFIIGPEWDSYFLECNTRPGFTEHSSALYTNAVNRLNEIEDVAALLVAPTPPPMEEEEFLRTYYAGTTRCPACRSDNITILGEGSITDTHLCNGCGLEFELIINVTGWRSAA